MTQIYHVLKQKSHKQCLFSVISTPFLVMNNSVEINGLFVLLSVWHEFRVIWANFSPDYSHSQSLEWNFFMQEVFKNTLILPRKTQMYLVKESWEQQVRQLTPAHISAFWLLKICSLSLLFYWCSSKSLYLVLSLGHLCSWEQGIQKVYDLIAWIASGR